MTTQDQEPLPELPEPEGAFEQKTADFLDDKGNVVGYETKEVDGYSAAQMHAYAKEALRLSATVAPAPAIEVAKALVAAKMACRHWNEFGPESGFSETMDQLEAALRPTEQAPSQVSKEMNEDGFLPCPFCGSELVSSSVGETGDGKPYHYIECESCAAMAEPDQWNKRAPSQPTKEQP